MVRLWVLLAAFFCCTQLFAQQMRTYTIKDGRMYISVDKQITDAALDSFIVQFELHDLGLKGFLRNNKRDSLLNQGWKIMVQNETGIVISKSLEAFENFDDPISRIMLTEKLEDFAVRFPVVSNKIIFGYNKFRNKEPFMQKDSIVCFFLRNYSKAGKVYLAGSFNNWSPTAQAMKQTDSGWIAFVKLRPGKYWYKFIVDDEWMVDEDNQLRENDGEGNINSVYFKTNMLFTLEGFTQAKNVFLSGSFNGWKTKDLRMHKTAIGWQLPLYLANGTHTYKFIVDGDWLADKKNPLTTSDGAGGVNSMIAIGEPYVFTLKGFRDAQKVMVAGSFNQWRDFELEMRRTADGWEFPYVIGPGNYEYKFIVDGKWISDPANSRTSKNDGNSWLIIEPNYTFKLKGFENAGKVMLAGDFNGWNPEAFAMKKTSEGWEFPLHLAAGKVRYKFIVDDKWILDPANKLWEQNEYGTGNSVIWIR